ncbi:MAG: sulfite exporter TauE/SafE family protein [Candidatus Marinimicrobia bacterium]|nr:sulfite exporter TauE/SafE family protein [Candidatus Neomarinimicrobiota bacterium]
MGSLIQLLIIGLAGGFISAGFGLGGGVVMVPLLVLFLKEKLVNVTPLSLAGIIPITGISLYIHLTNTPLNLNWEIFLFVSAASISGAILGRKILNHINSTLLSYLFSILLFIAAIRMSGLIHLADIDLPTNFYYLFYIIIGLFAGMSSILFGVGGGIIFVPAFTLIFKFPIHEAILYSLSIILPTTISGLILQLRARKHSIKYSNLAVIVLGGFTGSLVGYYINSHFDSSELSTAFSILLFLTGVQFTYKLFRQLDS